MIFKCGLLPYECPKDDPRGCKVIERTVSTVAENQRDLAPLRGIRVRFVMPAYPKVAEIFTYESTSFVLSVRLATDECCCVPQL